MKSVEGILLGARSRMASNDLVVENCSVVATGKTWSRIAGGCHCVEQMVDKKLSYIYLNQPEKCLQN